MLSISSSLPISNNLPSSSPSKDGSTTLASEVNTRNSINAVASKVVRLADVATPDRAYTNKPFSKYLKAEQQDKLSSYVTSLFSDKEDKGFAKFLKKEMNRKLQAELLVLRKDKFDNLIQRHAESIRNNLKTADELSVMEREMQSCCIRSSKRNEYYKTLAHPHKQIILTLKTRIADEIDLLLNSKCTQVIETYHTQKIKPLRQDIKHFQNKLKDSKSLRNSIIHFKWTTAESREWLPKLERVRNFLHNQQNISISLQNLIRCFELVIKGFHVQKFEQFQTNMQSLLESQLSMSTSLQDVVSCFERAIEGFHAHHFEKPQQELQALLKKQDDISNSLQELMPDFEWTIEELHAHKFEKLQQDMQDFLNKALDISIPLSDAKLLVQKIAYGLLFQNHNQIKFTRNFFEAAITHNGSAYLFAPLEFRDDKLVALTVSSLPSMLESVPKELRTPELCQKALDQDPEVMRVLGEPWISSAKKVEKAIRKKGGLIADTPKFQDDFDMACIAVSNDSESALKALSTRLKDNDEIFQLSITQSIHAWQHGSQNVKTNPKNVRLMFELIKDKHKNNRHIKREFVSNLQKVMGKAQVSRLHELLNANVEERYRDPDKFLQRVAEPLFHTDHLNKVEIVKVVVAYCPELLPELYNDLRTDPKIIEAAQKGPTILEEPSIVAWHFSPIETEYVDEIQQTVYPESKEPMKVVVVNFESEAKRT